MSSDQFNRYSVSKKLGMRGFSLVELSVVLIVIGLIIGAVSIGKDVHRNAVNQRIASEFTQGWLLAYDSYVAGRGVVPGDSLTNPTGCILGTCATAVTTPGTALCDNDLRTEMLAAGIGLPTGRSEGLESRYVYLDSNGNPQEIQVCFQNVLWSEALPEPGTYRLYPRNVMVMTGLTPALANFIDHYFDTVVDARFGDVRENSLAASTTTEQNAWSADDRAGQDGTTDRDESQVVTLTAFMRMHR